MSDIVTQYDSETRLEDAILMVGESRYADAQRHERVAIWDMALCYDDGSVFAVLHGIGGYNDVLLIGTAWAVGGINGVLCVAPKLNGGGKEPLQRALYRRVL